MDTYMVLSYDIIYRNISIDVEFIYSSCKMNCIRLAGGNILLSDNEIGMENILNKFSSIVK